MPYGKCQVRIMKIVFVIGILLLSAILTTDQNATAQSPTTRSLPTDDAAISTPPARESKIPPGAVKVTPESDAYPPRSHSDEYEAPIPLPHPINTAGAEDSPFILPDGKTLYFWFTPKTNVPAQKQILDGVTGIYVSNKIKGAWNKPERVLLQDPDKLALDGAQFIQASTMWFCSARTGYTGLHWFTAELKGNKWANWKKGGLQPGLSSWRAAYHPRRQGSSTFTLHGREAGGSTTSGSREKTDSQWRPPENVESGQQPSIRTVGR